MTGTKGLLQKHLAELQAQKADIDAKMADVNAKREAAAAEAIAKQEEAKSYVVERDTIMQAEGYLDLTKEISAVAKALGGRSLADNRG